MADSFFGFDTSVNNGNDCLDDDEDFDEQQYDALNDETFGNDASDEAILDDDWEAHHEQLAVAVESTKHKDSDLSLGNGDLAQGKPTTSQDVLKNVVPTPQIPLKPLENHNGAVNGPLNGLLNGPNEAFPKKICTLEEIERQIILTSSNEQKQNPLPSAVNNLIGVNQAAAINNVGPNPFFQPQLPQPRVLAPPPGFLPSYKPNLQSAFRPIPVIGKPDVNAGIFPPTQVQPHPLLNKMQMLPQVQPQMLNQANMFMPPHKMAPVPVNVDPRLAFPANFNIPPPPINYLNIDIYRPPPQFKPVTNQQSQMNGDINQMNGPRNFPNRDNSRDQHRENNYREQQNQSRYSQDGQRVENDRLERRNENRDEYAGLMRARERFWVMNIQLSQVNTGTPYFDDYYYTVYKARKAEKENNKQQNNNGNNSRARTVSVTSIHSNSSRRNNDNRNNNRNNQNGQQNQVNCKLYAPTQFENSLGKLQCGSITAPRKIIDMAPMGHEEANVMVPNTPRDKRVKQTLIELENIYALILRLEDVDNPLAVMNLLKLREIREKQKIQQLETATSEEKDAILKQLQDSTLVRIDNKFELINKITNALLHDDKFTNYFAIRKGKTVLLRFLPYLYSSVDYLDKLIELWIKLLSSVPGIGKRDQITDNILPKFFPLFKKFLETIDVDGLVNISNQLIDNKKIENTRMTPISKCVLYYLLANKLGVSCIAGMIVRCELLQVTSASMTDKHKEDWINFLTNIFETITMTNVRIETPIELHNRHVFARHLKRFDEQWGASTHKFYDVFCAKEN